MCVFPASRLAKWTAAAVLGILAPQQIPWLRGTTSQVSLGGSPVRSGPAMFP